MALNEYIKYLPLPTDGINYLNSHIRRILSLFLERFELNHYMAGVVDTDLIDAEGNHSLLTMPDYNYLNSYNQFMTKPDNIVNSNQLYVKNIKGSSELCINKNGSHYQLTSGGRLLRKKSVSSMYSTSNIHYVNGLYVRGGEASYSLDASTWVSSGPYEHVILAEKDEYFLYGKLKESAYNYPKMYRSKDCKTWQYIGESNVYNGNAKVFGNGVFLTNLYLTTENHMHVYKSTDAVNYTTVLTVNNGSPGGMIYINGKFRIIIYVNSVFYLYESTNGTAWTNKVMDRSVVYDAHLSFHTLGMVFYNNVYYFLAKRTSDSVACLWSTSDFESFDMLLSCENETGRTGVASGTTIALSGSTLYFAYGAGVVSFNLLNNAVNSYRYTLGKNETRFFIANNKKLLLCHQVYSTDIDKYLIFLDEFVSI